MRPGRREILFRARPAFTLIELSAVALLMALVAGGVAVTLRQPLSAARKREAFDQLSTFDANARRAAERSGRPGLLEFDRDLLSRFELNASMERSAEPVQRVRLPSRYTAELHHAGRGNGLSGDAVVVTPSGLSESYAVALSGEGQVRWFVVAGFSGQMTEVPDEASAQAMLQARGVDADASAE